MEVRRVLCATLLGCCLTADTALAQPAAPVALSITTRFDGQSETGHVTLATETSTTGQHVASLERTHTYDVDGSMSRKEQETRFTAGLPDGMTPQDRDTTAYQFLCRHWAKTGVDVVLRPMVVSGEFQTLSIGITPHRFQPSLDAGALARVDTWTGDVDTSLRVGDIRIMNLDDHDVPTIERLGKP